MGVRKGDEVCVVPAAAACQLPVSQSLSLAGLKPAPCCAVEIIHRDDLRTTCVDCLQHLHAVINSTPRKRTSTVADNEVAC